MSAAKKATAALVACVRALEEEYRSLKAEARTSHARIGDLILELRSLSAARTARSHETEAVLDLEDQTPFHSTPAGRKSISRSL